MWLIDVERYELKRVENPRQVPYTILSHTWGEVDEEVTFQDMKDLNVAKRKAGWQKIKETCRLTREIVTEDVRYAWVDTCCIDKSSSAELSEAINSMFVWYQNAERCYVWLSDLTYTPGSTKKLWSPQESRDVEEALRKCKWFRRGWTLQELIAPSTVHFYDKDWKFLEKKNQIAHILSKITNIDSRVLKGTGITREELDSYSIATRMSWAAKRETTRDEDLAYCLLGIFDVNMPLLYGEGPKAFLRLQQLIITQTGDLSLFGWVQKNQRTEFRGIFAKSPAEFVQCRYVKRSRDQFSIGNKFAIINNCAQLRAERRTIINRIGTHVYWLDCVQAEGRDKNPTEAKWLGIQLLKIGKVFVRSNPHLLVSRTDRYQSLLGCQIYVKQMVSKRESGDIVIRRSRSLKVLIKPKSWVDQKSISKWPKGQWSDDDRFHPDGSNDTIGVLSFTMNSLGENRQFRLVCGLQETRETTSSSWAGLFNNSDSEPNNAVVMAAEIEVVKDVIFSNYSDQYGYIPGESLPTSGEYRFKTHGDSNIESSGSDNDTESPNGTFVITRSYNASSKEFIITVELSQESSEHSEDSSDSSDSEGITDEGDSGAEEESSDGQDVEGQTTGRGDKNSQRSELAIRTKDSERLKKRKSTGENS